MACPTSARRRAARAAAASRPSRRARTPRAAPAASCRARACRRRRATTPRRAARDRARSRRTSRRRTSSRARTPPGSRRAACPSACARAPGRRRGRAPARSRRTRRFSAERVRWRRSPSRGMLSGTIVFVTPPKNFHAASSPSITASVVCRNVGHTNRYRLKHSVTMSTQSTRILPSRVAHVPIFPKSTCASSPGGASSTRTVGSCLCHPSSRLANRRSVGYDDVTPSPDRTRAPLRAAAADCRRATSRSARAARARCHGSLGAGAGRACTRARRRPRVVVSSRPRQPARLRPLDVPLRRLAIEARLARDLRAPCPACQRRSTSLRRSSSTPESHRGLPTATRAVAAWRLLCFRSLDPWSAVVGLGVAP